MVQGQLHHTQALHKAWHGSVLHQAIKYWLNEVSDPALQAPQVHAPGLADAHVDPLHRLPLVNLIHEGGGICHACRECKPHIFLLAYPRFFSCLFWGCTRGSNATRLPTVQKLQHARGPNATDVHKLLIHPAAYALEEEREHHAQGHSGEEGPSTALGGPVCSCCHGGRVGRSNLLLVPFVDNAGGSALRLLALGHCHAVSCGRAALPLVSCSTEKRPPGSQQRWPS
mmetsp:Transcript_7937/g.21190  ORF Transcript_7937/g.21190 Transcript_7937/m.21190 type:complete len:227 (-) Transcript_7937:225-905(-)